MMQAKSWEFSNIVSCQTNTKFFLIVFYNFITVWYAICYLKTIYCGKNVPNYTYTYVHILVLVLFCTVFPTYKFR